jgi:hypothetical protein
MRAMGKKNNDVIGKRHSDIIFPAVLLKRPIISFVLKVLPLYKWGPAGFYS